MFIIYIILLEIPDSSNFFSWVLSGWVKKVKANEIKFLRPYETKYSIMD